MPIRIVGDGACAPLVQRSVEGIRRLLATSLHSDEAVVLADIPELSQRFTSDLEYVRAVQEACDPHPPWLDGANLLARFLEKQRSDSAPWPLLVTDRVIYSRLRPDVPVFSAYLRSRGAIISLHGFMPDEGYQRVVQGFILQAVGRIYGLGQDRMRHVEALGGVRYCSNQFCVMRVCQSHEGYRALLASGASSPYCGMCRAELASAVFHARSSTPPFSFV